jgi:protocatechuate 3,4-dioxygenase beta subunit
MNASIGKPSKGSVSAIIAVSIIAVMLLSLLPATAGPGPTGATVMGKVTDINDGEPIEKALVVISYHGIQRSQLTDSNGRYSFMNVPECFCMKNIKVTKDGYRPESKDVGVSGVTVVNFQLLYMEKEPYTGSIVGTVTDINDGSPLDGAKVVLDCHEKVRTTFTDQSGEYRFDEVPECFCLKKVTASMDHYRPETKEVGVSGVTTVDFELMTEEMHPYDGTLSGVVSNADTGDPVPGARVTVEHDGETWSDVTDDEGRYSITSLPMCFCMKDVTVSAEGYETQAGQVAIDTDTVMDVALEPVDDLGPPSSGKPGKRVPYTERDEHLVTLGVAVAGVGLIAMGYYSPLTRV